MQDLPLQVPNQFLSVSQYANQAAAWGVGGLIGAVGSLSAVVAATGPLAPVLAAVFGGVVASLWSDFAGEAGVPAYTNLTVPVTPITNNMLNATELSGLTTNIQDDMSKQWTNILSALESTTFIETYLSNFGLLEAFQAMSGNQLDTSSTSGSGGQAPLAPETSVNETLSRLSWSAMIPAVFQWATVPSSGSSDNQPYNFPTADGQTTYLTNQPISLDYDNGQNGPDGAWDVAAGNFFTNGGDNNLDLAVTNSASDDVSILKGNGSGSFTAGPPVALGGPDGPEGIAVGNFINNVSARIWLSPTSPATRSASCWATATGRFRQWRPSPWVGPTGRKTSRLATS